jgi:hypothetical protein
VSQLGAGFGTEYPNVIDIRQTYRNGTVVLPDSDTRVDSEVLNDALAAIIALETTLGAGVQGAFASLAARLAALEAGGDGGGGEIPLTNVLPFTNQTTVILPSAAHQQGQQELFYAVYDTQTPRNLLAPASFTMASTPEAAVLAFAVPQSGVFMVVALTPDYVTPFATPATPPYEVVIPGTTHGLGEPYLFVQVYDAGTPARALEPGSLAIHTTTFDVTLAFTTPQAGTVVLAVGTPRYVQPFTAATIVTIPGPTHGLGSAQLLGRVYAPDGATVRHLEPGAFSVHPTTFDVVVGFAVPQSGVLVLTPVTPVPPGGGDGAPLTNVVSFTEQTSVTVPGAAHQQGQQDLFYAVYDTQTPRALLSPGAFAVYPTTYNVVVTFMLPQSGVVIIAALLPQYRTPFMTAGTPPYEVLIPGNAHGLADPYLFVQVYDGGNPAQALAPGSVTIETTTLDVRLSFAEPQSGTVVLAQGSPRYVQAFTAATPPYEVVITGATHGFGSASLLQSVYAQDGATLRSLEVGAFSVHPTTFEAVLTFAEPQSGVLILAPVPTVTPALFAVQSVARARTRPAPALTTQRTTNDRMMAQLLRSVERLTARLARLETTTHTLLLRQEAYVTTEDSVR